ncbi:RbsD/FucU family protein [Brevibacterium sp. 50QC2O2]|jgi:L-fucose mutarotase|uniref:RbsD/FucU family protein n=1 Tax=Brevibacterium TaxID=1696 RepID=UPI00211D0206|nr:MULTISPECIES: RbsD/FucU family protein [unclassified Brevibacterium]MCQ9385437.1 RbsD/FucU family protein [Brevibacterium sp. 68QC2CO]MCQ9388189.1 RbsD/FucU family protein [Brevibacterium sp. 50QC2O2]
MLKTPLLHPELLAALGRCGHGTQVLLADGNYPHNTGAPAAATRIPLNVTPGLLSVDQVLEPLAATVNIEAATFMLDATGGRAPAVDGYGALLPDVPFTGLERFAFYDAARDPNIAVVVATGDQRQYANLLLTIGVVA